MHLNTEKSSVMWFKPCNQSNVLLPEVKIDGMPLSEVTSQKYLGITFDNKLDRSAHVSAGCSIVF